MEPARPSCDLPDPDTEVTPNPNHAVRASSVFRRTRQALDALDAHAATADQLGPETTAAESIAWLRVERALLLAVDAAFMAEAHDKPTAFIRRLVDTSGGLLCIRRRVAEAALDDDDFDDVPSSLPRVPCKWPERCTCDRCVDEVPR